MERTTKTAKRTSAPYAVGVGRAWIEKGVLSMQRHDVKIGSIYIVKVSGKLCRIRITREHGRGGWCGTNLATGREIRIPTAARLRAEACPAQSVTPDEARRIVDQIDF